MCHVAQGETSPCLLAISLQDGDHIYDGYHSDGVLEKHHPRCCALCIQKFRFPKTQGIIKSDSKPDIRGKISRTTVKHQD